MTIKTLQWNVGGRRYRDQNTDPLKDVYTNTNPKYFIDYINAHDTDIITLQESHITQNYSFSEQISKATVLKYFIYTLRLLFIFPQMIHSPQLHYFGYTP